MSRCHKKKSRLFVRNPDTNFTENVKTITTRTDHDLDNVDHLEHLPYLPL